MNIDTSQVQGFGGNADMMTAIESVVSKANSAEGMDCKVMVVPYATDNIEVYCFDNRTNAKSAVVRDSVIIGKDAFEQYPEGKKTVEAMKAVEELTFKIHNCK